jgi:precorrin-6B methylase 2
MRSPALQAELKGMVYGFWMSQCVYVAAILGIADCLKDGPKTCAELAGLTRSHPAALCRLLRALASIGIFSEDENGRFMFTPLAELLRTDTDGSIHAEVLHMLDPSSWAPWGQLLHSVRTGEAAFPKIFGEDVWEYRARHPEISAIFDTMATVMSKHEVDVILQHLDLSNVGRIIDVGGGKGALIAEILSRHTNLRGVLFDQPHVVAGADALLQAAGVADRCRIEPGDFFNKVPKDGDMYLLKAIIHNWNNEAAVAILRNCRQAMSSHARIVVVESVLDPARPTFGNLMDLHMLVIHGGQERTPAGFGALFDASGFRLRNILTTATDMSLIEGIPA